MADITRSIRSKSTRRNTVLRKDVETISVAYTVFLSTVFAELSLCISCVFAAYWRVFACLFAAYSPRIRRVSLHICVFRVAYRYPRTSRYFSTSRLAYSPRAYSSGSAVFSRIRRVFIRVQGYSRVFAAYTIFLRIRRVSIRVFSRIRRTPRTLFSRIGRVFSTYSRVFLFVGVRAHAG